MSYTPGALASCVYYLNGNLCEIFMGHTLTPLQDIKLFVVYALTSIPNHLINNGFLSLLASRTNFLSLLVLVTAELLYYPCRVGWRMKQI